MTAPTDFDAVFTTLAGEHVAAEQAVEAQRETVSYAPAQVTRVVPNSDGTVSVQVAWRTGTYWVDSYLASYTPAVGNVVWCGRHFNLLFILGKYTKAGPPQNG